MSRLSTGELLHMDTKKLHRFDKPANRVTADRTQNTPWAGSQALHMAIDDHPRVGFSMLLAYEKEISACAFSLATLRYCKALGVRVSSVMTASGSTCKSRAFARLLRRLGIRHICTRPYAPRTNGKAERFIQTLLGEGAYALIYPNSSARASELAPWMCHYNFRRPHSTTSHRSPAYRLEFDGNKVMRNYN